MNRCFLSKGRAVNFFTRAGEGFIRIFFNPGKYKQWFRQYLRPPPPRILILGQAKTGTSALFFKIKPCMPPRTLILFEPKDPLEPFKQIPAEQAVLSKVLFPPVSIEEIWKRHNKHIFIIRDPRDRIVSHIFWHAQIYYEDISRIYTLYRLFRMLEEGNRDISIAALYREVFGEKANFKIAHGRIMAIVKEYHPFIYLYDDMLCGNDAALKRYLGREVSSEPEDSSIIRRVTRTKSSGNWRNAFRSCDVTYFKKGTQDFLRFFGYNAEDWETSPSQRLDPEKGSRYFLKLINQEREGKGLARLGLEELDRESNRTSNLKAIICGHERGGTTLLLEIFRRHPSIASGFQGGFLLADRPRDFPGVPPYRENGMPSWKIAPEDLVRICDTESWYDVYERLAKISPVTQGRRSGLIDKTPRYLRFLPEVMRKMPATPVLVVVRDPRAVIGSYLKRNPPQKESLSEEIDRFCIRYRDYWNGYQRAVAQGFSSRILLVRYEELCLKPEEMARRAFDFLDLDFQPGFLKFGATFPAVHGKHVSADYMYEYRQNLSKEHQGAILQRLECAKEWFWNA